jgi:hypothetical protein
LFFTDKEMAYICNQDTCSETANIPQRHHLRDLASCLPQMEDRSISVWNILGGYTKRQLTYDKDGLAAIEGALNTLSTEASPTYHIWGVPMWPDLSIEDSEGYGIMSLGILWLHALPCFRRPGFPSWSPLGWKSKVRSIEDLRLSGDVAIEIWWKDAYRNLSTATFKRSDVDKISSTEESKTLRITAQTFPFKRPGTPTYGRPLFRSSPFMIHIEVDQGTDIFVYLHWDIQEGDVGDIESGIYVILHTRDCGISLLFLDGYGEYYERSGIFTVLNYFPVKDWSQPSTFFQDKNGRAMISSPKEFLERVGPALFRIAKKQTFLLR